MTTMYRSTSEAALCYLIQCEPVAALGSDLYSTAVHQRVVESGLVTSFAYEINFVSRTMDYV